MFNMATMAAEECRTSNSERAYYQFLAALGEILGRHISLGSEDESNAFAIYSGGYTCPREAAEEFRGQGW